MKHLILSALIVLPPALQAQQPVPAPKPMLKAGEVATYAVQLVADRRNVEDTLTVTEVAGGTVKVKYQRTGPEPKDAEALYTDEWNQVVSATSGSRIEPHTDSLKFPLEVGKSWEAKFVVSSPSGAKSRGSIDTKVASFEKVKTPAGEFDAYRVTSEGWINGVSWNGSFKRTMTQWYAPSVHRVVRTEWKEYRRGGDEGVSELKAFKAAP